MPPQPLTPASGYCEELCSLALGISSDPNSSQNSAPLASSPAVLDNCGVARGHRCQLLIQHFVISSQTFSSKREVSAFCLCSMCAPCAHCAAAPCSKIKEDPLKKNYTHISPCKPVHHRHRQSENRASMGSLGEDWFPHNSNHEAIAIMPVSHLPTWMQQKYTCLVYDSCRLHHSTVTCPPFQE